MSDSMSTRNVKSGHSIVRRQNTTLHDVLLGDDVRIYERVSIKKSVIGSRAVINVGTYIENATVEADALVGPNCTVVGVTHELTVRGALVADSWSRVHIGKGAFIGAGVIVLPGRRIGAHAVVAAGCKVTKNVPPYHIAIERNGTFTTTSLKTWLMRSRATPR